MEKKYKTMDGIGKIITNTSGEIYFSFFFLVNQNHKFYIS